MIKTVILGQPYWSNRFAGVLEQCPIPIEARFLPLREVFTPAGFRAAMGADLFLRMGYRPGAPTWRGRIFDGLWALLRAWNPRARAVHYWIGTDVLNTCEDAKAGRLRPGPMKRAAGDLHWADAPWLVDELKTVGLASKYIALPVPLEDVQVPDRLPAPFTVLTYIPDNRADFYDGPSIRAAAEALPEVRFEVIGGMGTWADKPLPNLTFFGWQVDVRPFLARASVVARLVRHDGMGGTVREALQTGRHVIYSQAMPCVQVVPYQDPAALIAALRGLHDRFLAGDLLPNVTGHDYVQATFDLKACLGTYATDLRTHLGRSLPPENEKP